MLPSTLPAHSQVHSWACSQGRSHMYSMADSQPAWMYVPTPAVKKLSSTLPSTLSSKLPIALNDTASLHDYTLPRQLTRCSQVHSQYVLKYTPGHDLKDAPNCTRWHTPSLLDCTLPNQLSGCSQAHSRARCPVHSQLHSMTLPACLTIRSQESSQDAPKYTLSSSSSTLAGILTRTLPITLNCTIPSCLTFAPMSALKTLPRTLRMRFKVHLWVCSQVHSQACSQGRSPFHSMEYT